MARAQRHIKETYSDYLLKKSYKERPVSVEELLCSDMFFGTLTGGGKAVFPIWNEKLTEIMREDSKYLIVLTGAIGTGKSRTATWGVASGMQRVLCLKKPWEFFELSAGGRIAVVFFNLTKSLGESKGFRVFQSHLLSSPWFRSRGIVKGREPNEWLDIPLFEYKIASPYAQGFGAIGEDVLFAVMDEVDAPGVSDKQRIRVLQAYENTVRRFESRFVDDIYKDTLGKFFLVASKQEKLSFLNTFVVKRKGSRSMVVVDIPYWVAKAGRLSGKNFSVVVGDAYTPSKILDSLKEKKEFQKQGHSVVEVPIEFIEAFQRDPNGALREIAGVSVTGMRVSKLFPSEKILTDCYDKTKEDPAIMTTISIGLEDEIDIMRYIDFTKIRMPMSVPRYIHCDIAYSGDGDSLSLGMSGIKHWTKSNVMMPDGTFEVRRVPVVETDFVIRLKGRPGDEIPLFKMRKFILDLRATGFNIKKYTADLAIMSADTKQILSRAGIECDYLSLDRDIKPYQTFRDLVSERRWICHWNTLFHFELVNLEIDREKQKVDHPDEVVDIEFLDDGNTKEVVVRGSKDLADGGAGSVYSALEDADSVPVDRGQVTQVMKKITEKGKTVSERKDTLWWLREKTITPKSETYLLLDSEGCYWIWFRENPASKSELNGPHSDKMLNLRPIKVVNPQTFDPSLLKSGKESDKTSEFQNMFRKIREHR